MPVATSPPTRAERLAATRRLFARAGIEVCEHTRWLERHGLEVVPDLEAAPAGCVRQTDHAAAAVPARLYVYVAGRLAGTVLALSPRAWTWGSGEERAWLRGSPVAAALACAAHHVDIHHVEAP